MDHIIRPTGMEGRHAYFNRERVDVTQKDGKKRIERSTAIDPFAAAPPLL
ncbi:hypothetical protein [Uliginosibacterium flavum]|uniref:Uncharacterized protein n=1 Tax=Uliginosibacterium flavum TaxID=1396831 RepID=A0ABV2TT23_9RHOO